jgi:membrane protease subunit HflK
MSIISGWGDRVRGLYADNKGPWGSGNAGAGGSGGGSEPPSDESEGEGPPQGPWGEAPRRRRSSIGSGANVASLDQLLRRRLRFGGGGGLPGRPDRSMILWAVLGFVLVWLVFTSIHSIAPGQRGVVTQFGRYSRTLGPGVSFTFPSPIERVKKIDVENIRTIDLGSSSSDDLMLTGDQ